MSTTVQRTVKQTTTALNNANDSLYLQRVIQKVKPELIKNQEEATTRLIYLKNTSNVAAAGVKNPAAILNSLLHKSTSISKDRNSVGYEETFNIYK